MLVPALVKPKKGKFSAHMINGILVLTTKSEAKNGKANSEITTEIKKMLKKEKYSEVEIKIHGEKSKRKTIEIQWQTKGSRDLIDVFG